MPPSHETAAEQLAHLEAAVPNDYLSQTDCQQFDQARLFAGHHVQADAEGEATPPATTSGSIGGWVAAFYQAELDL